MPNMYPRYLPTSRDIPKTVAQYFVGGLSNGWSYLISEEVNTLHIRGEHRYNRRVISNADRTKKFTVFALEGMSVDDIIISLITNKTNAHNPLYAEEREEESRKMMLKILSNMRKKKLDK